MYDPLPTIILVLTTTAFRGSVPGDLVARKDPQPV